VCARACACVCVRVRTCVCARARARVCECYVLFSHAPKVCPKYTPCALPVFPGLVTGGPSCNAFRRLGRCAQADPLRYFMRPGLTPGKAPRWRPATREGSRACTTNQPQSGNGATRLQHSALTGPVVALPRYVGGSLAVVPFVVTSCRLPSHTLGKARGPFPVWLVCISMNVPSPHRLSLQPLHNTKEVQTSLRSTRPEKKDCPIAPNYLSVNDLQGQKNCIFFLAPCNCLSLNQLQALPRTYLMNARCAYKTLAKLRRK